MKNRNPIAVFILSLFTFNIYSIFHLAATKGEMNSLKGTDVPSGWLQIIPFVNFYFWWKYGEAVEKTTDGKMQAIVVFLLLFFFPPAACALAQSEFNKISTQG